MKTFRMITLLILEIAAFIYAVWHLMHALHLVFDEFAKLGKNFKRTVIAIKKKKKTTISTLDLLDSPAFR